MRRDANLRRARLPLAIGTCRRPHGLKFGNDEDVYEDDDTEDSWDGNTAATGAWMAVMAAATDVRPSVRAAGPCP